MEKCSFRGVLDELRFYNRALTSFEVQDLYIPVDKITSPDTVLFTGTSMQVRLPVTCASICAVDTFNRSQQYFHCTTYPHPAGNYYL